MARLVVREFSKAKTAYARKKFTANGREFLPGQEFPWRRLAVTVRKAKAMFEAGLLMHKDGAGVAQPMAVDMADAVEVSVVSAEASSAVDGYDLDAIDDMGDLRRIADEIGAPYKRSKDEQRQAIRDHLCSETSGKN